MTDQDPQEPAPERPSTTEEIFRQALAQQQAVVAQSMADITTRNAEMFDHLKLMTAFALQRQIRGMSAVSYAAGLDADFRTRIVEEAEGILRDRGILPSEPEPTDEPSEDPAAPAGPPGTADDQSPAEPSPSVH